MSDAYESLEGQVAVVTGSGRGLGRGYATELARRGAAVVINDFGKDEDGTLRSAGTAAEIVALGGKAVADASDISTVAGGKAVIDTALSAFGRIDILINNAGFVRPHVLEEMTDEDLESVVNVHLLGSFNTVRAAWPHMRSQGYGRVVLTSSSSSFGQKGQANYVSAKGALISLARALAAEGDDFDFRANCILPFAESLISVNDPLVGKDTPAIRLMLNAMTERRSVDTVVPMVTYLASRECSVSGDAFSALAGRYARVIYGLTDGWIADDPHSVAAEDIGANLEEIMSTERFTIPMRIEEEIRGVLGRLVERGLVAKESA